MKRQFESMRLKRAAVALAAALTMTVPAAAAPFPRPEQLRAPAAILGEIAEMVREREPDPAVRLARLDVILRQMREPDQTRGVVQFLRARQLVLLERRAEARGVAEEAMRLLPGYSGPLFVATEIELYSDRPALAADHLLRASEIDPELASRAPAHEIGNLMHRLRAHRERGRLGRLAERLIEINWRIDDLDVRSQIALEAIRWRIGAGDAAGGRALLSRLFVPADFQRLLVDRRYAALWSDIERIAGERHERLWPDYLAEVRARFDARSDSADVRRYADALYQAGQYRTMARVIAPLFERPLDAVRDYDLVWTANSTAEALARLGRWSEVERLFDRASATWPLGDDANALNIAANRARFQFLAGNAAAGAAAFDPVVANAERHRGEVSAEALAAMHLYRACAMREAGRANEAARSASAVLAAGSVIQAATLHLCFDRHGDARAELIAGLADEATRTDVLWFVQPSDGPPIQSDYGRRFAARLAALKRDAILLRAVSRYGRVLPHAPNAGAPKDP